MVMPPNLLSMPFAPLTKMVMAQLTSGSSSVPYPSPLEEALSRNSTGPLICMIWMEMARLHAWRCLKL